MIQGAWLKHPQHPVTMAGSVQEVAVGSYILTGTTRDVTGATIPSCVIKLFRSSDDALIATTTSSSQGFYQFALEEVGTYYVTAYKSGAPALAGISVDLVV